MRLGLVSLFTLLLLRKICYYACVLHSWGQKIQPQACRELFLHIYKLDFTKYSVTNNIFRLFHRQFSDRSFVLQLSKLLSLQKICWWRKTTNGRWLTAKDNRTHCSLEDISVILHVRLPVPDCPLLAADFSVFGVLIVMLSNSPMCVPRCLNWRRVLFSFTDWGEFSFRTHHQQLISVLFTLHCVSGWWFKNSWF